MRFGMHLSFKDGPKFAQAIGCQALQVFCGNPRGWQKSPLDPQFVAQFREEIKANQIDPVVVHATYLINPASNTEKFLQLSCDSIATELERSKQIGAKYYVLHIGNHGGAGPEIGRQRVAKCMRHAAAQVPNGPEILFENTAGCGTTLGTTFEEIAQLMKEIDLGDRMGLCLDTCHALAAGYDLRTPAGATAMIDKIDATLGLKALKCIHLNDSKGELGSKLDRHEHIGKGCIGTAGFRALFADKRLWNLPAILETPRENVQDEWDNLWTAIELARDSGAMSSGTYPTKPARPSGSAGVSARTKSASKSKKERVGTEAHTTGTSKIKKATAKAKAKPSRSKK